MIFSDQYHLAKDEYHPILKDGKSFKFEILNKFTTKCFSFHKQLFFSFSFRQHNLFDFYSPNFLLICIPGSSSLFSFLFRACTFQDRSLPRIYFQLNLKWNYSINYIHWFSTLEYNCQMICTLVSYETMVWNTFWLKSIIIILHKINFNLLLYKK